MPYKRGNVVLVLFPDSNLRTAKRRPALVVQANNLNTGLEQNIVAMITSNMTRSGHPGRVTLARNSSQGRESGVLMDSVIMTDNLATIREIEIDRAIGNISDTSEIDRALQKTLGPYLTIESLPQKIRAAEIPLRRRISIRLKNTRLIQRRLPPSESLVIRPPQFSHLLKFGLLFCRKDVLHLGVHTFS